MTECGSSIERGRSYSHGDGVLLARLALRGRLEEVPEFLFLSRRHAGQSARMEGDRHSYVVWFDPRNRGKLVFPRWRTFFEYFRSIRRAPLTLTERLKCYKGLFQRAYVRRRVLQEEVTYQARRVAGRFVPFLRPKEDGRSRSTGP